MVRTTSHQSVNNMENKRGTNQYEVKIKYRKLIITLFAIIAIIGLYQWYVNPARKVKTDRIEQVTVKDEGLTPEQRAVLEKQAELAKREQIALNKKAALQDDYDAKMKAIETDLSDIRAQKVTSFTSAKKQ